MLRIKFKWLNIPCVAVVCMFFLILPLHPTSSAHADQNVMHLPWFNLGTAAQGPWVPGYIKLITPIHQREGNMFSIKISGYRYGSGGTPVDISCGGYAYAASGLLQKDCHTEGTADPVGIGVENDMVIISIGSGQGRWYYDHFTAEYVGWKEKDPADFQWKFVYQVPPATSNTNNVVIDDSGGNITASNGIGIGTHPGSYKLNAAGTIRAEEIIVNTSGADYVFSPEYKLPSLAEVEQHIREKGHLPDIPSTTEVNLKGIGVARMQTKLLEKIEELTLYLIELKKGNEALQAKNAELERRLVKLEAGR